jgi:hypothetical protein
VEGWESTTLSRAYMLFLARWACQPSWKETADAFHTSWDKVYDAVEYVVGWGLEHRTRNRFTPLVWTRSIMPKATNI